jgi:5-methyltetrahydropteroyltriglutamate--homocysteine methyltransferase
LSRSISLSRGAWHTTESIAVVRRHVDALNAGDFGLDELFADDFVIRQPAGDRYGKGAIRDFVVGVRRLLPDIDAWVDVIFADDAFKDGHRVGVLLSYDATNAQLGQRVSVRELQLYRVVEGKIAERWYAADRRAIADAVRRPRPAVDDPVVALLALRVGPRGDHRRVGQVLLGDELRGRVGLDDVRVGDRRSFTPPGLTLSTFWPESCTYGRAMREGKMLRSTDRILTTHVGSLARPDGLLELMRARANGEPIDQDAYGAWVRTAVADVVRKQAESGVDVVSDGEQSKVGFFQYVRERLTGFEPAPESGARPSPWVSEFAAFPEYYKSLTPGRGVAPNSPVVCTGPVTYRGQDALRIDIENFKAALGEVRPEEAFMPASAPRGRDLGRNEHYRTHEEYLGAVADALHVEYQAIVDAGFILQVDDPALTYALGHSPSLSPAERRTEAGLHVEATNRALQGIPEDRVRFHTCYGIDEGPRTTDVPLKEMVDFILKINAGAYSFEAANPRHEHEWHVWEDTKLPEGKVLIPGVIGHVSNIVEHPEWIAERIVRYARVVGRENVIAGSDCGFSSQATWTPNVHPTVVWAKFQAMKEGAELATKQLWGRSA